MAAPSSRPTQAAPSPLRLSVVIPHLNQPAMLERCLRSLAAGHRRPDEVIVVDNGSTEMPLEACAAYPGAVLLREATPGPGPARNLGAARATGDALAFIDADCIADPDWLAAAAREMRDPAAAILGGDVRIALADPDRLTPIEAYESIYAYRMDLYIARQGFTGTGNLVVRRAVLDDVGPFAGLEVSEDRDWGQRATAKGHPIRYVPGMRAFHPARESFSEIFRKWDRHIAHDYAQVRGLGGRLSWGAKTLAMTLSPLVEAPRIAASDRVAGPRDRAAAFAALARVRLYRAGRMAWLLAGGDPARLFGRWRENP